MKGPKRQFSCEKFFTLFSLDLAPFTSRVSLMFSLFPGVMWKRKWDNAQSVLVTGSSPLNSTQQAHWLTPSVAAFLPHSLAGAQGSPLPGVLPPPRPAGRCRPPCFPSVAPPCCYSLFHPSALRNAKDSFPPLLPMIPTNLCLALSHQGTARACPTPQPSQNEGSGLVCKGSPASTAPTDISFVLESQSQLRILWMKDQPRWCLSGLAHLARAVPQGRRESWGINACPNLRENALQRLDFIQVWFVQCSDQEAAENYVICGNPPCSYELLDYWSTVALKKSSSWSCTFKNTIGGINVGISRGKNKLLHTRPVKMSSVKQLNCLEGNTVSHL